jgi:hypothetical protein
MYEFISLLSNMYPICLFMRGGDSTPNSHSHNYISIGRLSEAKKTALRRGVWFRSLNHVERGIIDLTVRYVDNIKSSKLAKVVTAIMEKLQTTIESMEDKFVRTVGLPLARKISNIAIGWGNLSAVRWAEDLGFAKYLAFNLAKT